MTKEALDHIANGGKMIEQPAPTNCRHCGGPDNVLCAGQCKNQPAQQQQVPVAAEKDYTTTRNSWTGRATHKCNHCGRDDFRSEHGAKFHECEAAHGIKENT